MSTAADSTPPENDLAEGSTVPPREASALVDAGALFIDVCGPAWRESNGMFAIPSARIVAKDAVDAAFDLESSDKLPELADKDQHIVVICGSINGSGPVTSKLQNRGFTHVVHVEGGLPAWKDAGLPTVEWKPIG